MFITRGTTRRTSGGLWLATMSLILVCGCGESPEGLARVEGVVLLDGKPLAGAGVVFQPNVGPLATGRTDGSGRFTLTTANQEGAVPGEHVVTIAQSAEESFVSETGGTMGPPTTQSAAKPQGRLPVKYSSPERSDLNATVESGRTNTFDFALESGSQGY